MSANFDQLDDEMADPTKYTPGYSFSDYQASNPADPLPADEVDTELAAISNSVDQVVEAIRNVRRSDGALKNLIVTYDSLSADMKARLAAVGFDGTEEDIDEIIAGVLGMLEELPDADDDVEKVVAIQADGAVVNASNIARFHRYDANGGKYNADPDATTSINTLGIQAAIDDAAGGGIVRITKPGVYQTFASAETTVLKGTGAQFAASTAMSLLLRDGVYLELGPGVIIENTDPTRTIVGFASMQSGGIIGGWLRSTWTPASSDAGSGIVAWCTDDPNDDPNSNLLFEDLRISGVGSYGLGMQFGFFKNNRYRNLWIHDTGADAVDHKTRPMLDGTQASGISLDGLLAERYGRRTGIVASAAIDIRGPVMAQNITVREAGYTSQGNVGIRLSAGIYSGADIRQPSAGAVVTNVDLDAGDPTIAGTKGIVLLDSGGVVDGGRVKNFDIGVSEEGSSSGYGSNAGARVANITVEAARTTSFNVGDARTSLENCYAVGQNETFEEDQGNLANAQTVFVSPRDFDAAAVQVYNNGTLLTLTTDYSVTGTDTITLVSGVALSDVVQIVSPTPIGYTVTAFGGYTKLVNCGSRFVTASRDIHATALATTQENGNLFESEGFLATFGTSSTITLQARGAATNYEVDWQGKGTGGHTFRSQGVRGLRVVNASASSVNWTQVSGSLTTAPVEISAQGADANISIKFTPKGTTSGLQAPIANVRDFADDAAASAGGVPVGGFYRTASALKVRVA